MNCSTYLVQLTKAPAVTNRHLLNKPPPVNTIKASNSTLIYDSIKKLELFANTMEQSFRAPLPSHPSGNYVHETLVNHKNSNRHQKTIFFTPGEIQTVICKFANKSALGPDTISNCDFKHCSKQAILHLCHILYGCTQLEYFLSC